MKKRFYYFIIILTFLLSSTLFGQLYSGPAVGSVTSGVEVSTDDFLSSPFEKKSLNEPNPIDEYYNSQQRITETKKTLGNYSYIEDNNTNRSLNSGIGISFELNSFSAIPMSGSIPPDPHMAVGPNHVIAMVNGLFSIYDRDGNLIKSIAESAWVLRVLLTPTISDPQVIYDHYTGRWFMLWLTINDGAQVAPFVICYSDDENPLGTWYMYAIGSELNGNVSDYSFGDYPKVGYDDQAIYIESRQFAFAGGRFYDKIRILNKSELYTSNGGPLTWTDFWNIKDPGDYSYHPDVIRPSISYDAGTNEAYFVWANEGGANYYILYKISDPINNPVLTGVRVPCTFYDGSPRANQLGGGSPRIDVFTRMANAPFVRDGKIYAAHSIENTQHSGYGSLKYFVIESSTNSLIEEIEQGAQGYFYIDPAIAVDQNHNVAITYSRSADNEYVGAYYSTRLGTDPPGTLSPSKVMVKGKGNYIVTYGSGRNRWGDYFAAALDPENQFNIWLYTEYAAEINTWGTWLTELRMVPFTGIYGFIAEPEIDFGDVELGFESDIIDVYVANFGEEDLIITNIPSSLGDFSLINPPTFNVSIPTYDSLKLEFKYTPYSLGTTQEFFPISSNDPNISGISVSGNAYQIDPAFTGILYGSSGISNNGDILSIDKTTGQGTIIGNSLYNEVTSLTVHPVTNELYGLISGGTATSEIVRINASAGDAYTLYTLDLYSLSGIAFDTTGTLYLALRTGEIYSLDLLNGMYTLVATASINVNAIAFDPATNELWAAYWKALGSTKDQIYKIDLTTGNADLIGETGLDILTDDLAFDESGSLFGSAGNTVNLNDLISINKSDGSASIIGSIGFPDITGLAYALNGLPLDVEDEDLMTPDGYNLSQNYPNPFNPETTIGFNLPVNSNVTITIYNLLGQVILTLVSKEFNAGYQKVEWKGNDKNAVSVSSGIYFYELKVNGTNGIKYTEMKKMILMR